MQLSTKGLAIFGLILFLSGYSVASLAPLNSKEARRMIARLGGIADLPEDKVRIKSIRSGMGSDAVVEAEIELAFRFTQVDRNWQIAEIRLGDNRWESLKPIIDSINREKAQRTIADLQTLKAGLEAYYKEHGSYVKASNIAELSSVLSPKYVNRVLRLDGWGREFIYKESAGTIKIESLGADGAPDSGDEIAIEITRPPGPGIRQNN